MSPAGINEIPTSQANSHSNFTQRKAEISLSYLEIYNENVNDLLNPSKKNLEVRENKNGEVVVDQLTQIVVSNKE